MTQWRTFLDALQHVTKPFTGNSKKRSIHSPAPVPLQVAWIKVNCIQGRLSDKTQERRQEILSTHLKKRAISRRSKPMQNNAPGTGLESEVSQKDVRQCSSGVRHTSLSTPMWIQYSLNHTLNFHRYIKCLPRAFIMFHWSILLFLCQ